MSCQRSRCVVIGGPP